MSFCTVRVIDRRPLLVFSEAIHSTMPSRCVHLAGRWCAEGHRGRHTVMPESLPMLANRSINVIFSKPSIHVVHVITLPRIWGIDVFQPSELHRIPMSSRLPHVRNRHPGRRYSHRAFRILVPGIECNTDVAHASKLTHVV